MIDDNWDLISGADAHAIEVLNYSNQVNVIEAPVHLLMHHHGAGGSGCQRSPNAEILKEFHRTATLFLLEKPGQFRDGEVVVRTAAGETVHQPPPALKVNEHIGRFEGELARAWSSGTAQELAAYCLWMVNWVHPFKNGNGRTARAFCYAVLSLKLGFVLPGSPTVIDLIMETRDDYQSALKVADLAFEQNGIPDLVPMTTYIDQLLARQLSSI